VKNQDIGRELNRTTVNAWMKNRPPFALTGQTLTSIKNPFPWKNIDLSTGTSDHGRFCTTKKVVTVEAVPFHQDELNLFHSKNILSHLICSFSWYQICNGYYSLNRSKAHFPKLILILEGFFDQGTSMLVLLGKKARPTGSCLS
jgi:hypothetical protein